MKYILDNRGEPLLCHSLMDWANWFENADRVVARDRVGIFYISTIFLGIDYGFRGIPILWETMVFEGDNDEELTSIAFDRCGGSKEQAEAMHAEMIRTVRTRMAELKMVNKAVHQI